MYCCYILFLIYNLTFICIYNLFNKKISYFAYSKTLNYLNIKKIFSKFNK